MAEMILKCIEARASLAPLTYAALIQSRSETVAARIIWRLSGLGIADAEIAWLALERPLATGPA